MFQISFKFVLLLFCLLICIQPSFAQNPQSAVILPDTISFIVNNAIDPIEGFIHLGNFWGPLGASDVDLESIMINDVYEPEFALVMNYHPEFEGKVIRLGIYLQDFNQTYGPWWDTTETTFLVTGNFTDVSNFTIDATFTAIGHTSGDVNGDRFVNAGDPLYLINFIFRSGPQPPFPILRADANGDETVNIGDVAYLINYLYRSGSAPVSH